MKIVVSSRAKKDLMGIDKEIRRKIYDAIYKLTDISRKLNIKKLKGFDNTNRLRVGDYRVIYKLDNDILIINIKHRSEVYRKL
jgi:mRNA interferase RelE/StbE